MESTIYVYWLEFHIVCALFFLNFVRFEEIWYVVRVLCRSYIETRLCHYYYHYFWSMQNIVIIIKYVLLKMCCHCKYFKWNGIESKNMWRNHLKTRESLEPEKAITLLYSYAWYKWFLTCARHRRSSSNSVKGNSCALNANTFGKKKYLMQNCMLAWHVKIQKMILLVYRNIWM